MIGHTPTPDGVIYIWIKHLGGNRARMITAVSWIEDKNWLVNQIDQRIEI